MQVAPPRRSNRERTEATRAALIAAARALFVEKSYAETGTPEIAAAAGVTRGALYHHFADKQALFTAVVEAEAQAVAAEIDAATAAPLSTKQALLSGMDAFFAAMAVPGRTRLLLLDGPAVLGHKTLDEIDQRHGGRTLHEGLAAAIEAGEMCPLPTDALATQLSAMSDRAALAIEAGASAEDHRTVIAVVIESLFISRT